jgi:four helix bundle protein
MATIPFHELTVYKVAEELSDLIWDVVGGWSNFARDTVGKQVTRSADSIGANIAEGNGRGTPDDNRRFVRMARGSLNETRHWLRRAFRRKLLTKEQSAALQPLIERLGPLVGGLLRSIEKTRRTKRGGTDATDPTNG